MRHWHRVWIQSGEWREMSSDSVRPIVHLALLLFVLTAQVGVKFSVNGNYETIKPVLDIDIVLEIYIHSLNSIDTDVANASNHIDRARAGITVGHWCGFLTATITIVAEYAF